MWKALVPVAVVLAAIVGAIAWKACHRTTAPIAHHDERCPPVIVRPRGPLAAPARVSGHVMKKTGGALAGATVALVQTSLGTDFGAGESPTLVTSTDANGAWAIEHVAPGDYVASAAASGLLPTNHPRIAIAAGESHAGVDMSLEAGGARVRGVVSDYDGRPIAGVRVEVRDETARAETELRAPFVALTDADGKYDLSLPNGRHWFTVRHDDFASTSHSVEVAGNAQSRDFKLVRGGTIYGKVVARPSGKPVAGAIVVASNERRQLSWREEATADDEGKFTLRGAPPGVILLEAYGVGVASAQPERVGMNIGGVVDVPRVVVEPAVSVCGRIVAKGTNDGIAGASIWAGESSSTNPRAHEPIGRDGAFEIVGVKRGSHRLLARAQDRLPFDGKSFDVGDVDVTGVIVEMETGVTLAGRVDPPSEVSVAIVRQDDGAPRNMMDSLYVSSLRGTSDASGAWRLDHVPPGKFVIVGSTNEGATGQLHIVVTDRDQKALAIKLGRRASVSGRVVDTTGTPMVGLEILARPDARTRARITMLESMGPGAVSDANGEFKIVVLEAGVYRIGSGETADMVLMALQATTPPKPIEVAAGADIRDIVVAVEPRVAEIRGVVTLRGKPARGVWVTARLQGPEDRPFPPELNDSEPALTDANGSFVIAHLRDRTYTLVAEGAGAETNGEKVGVKAGDTTTIELRGIGRLSGRVRLRGEPVTSYDLQCRRGPMERVDLHSDAANGSYVLDGLPPGHYLCGVSTSAGNGAGEVDVPAGAATLDLTLVPWATITGRAVSALTGAPIPHLNATAFSDSGADDRTALMARFEGDRRPETDANGGFTIEHVGNGGGHVTLWDPSITYPISEKRYAVTAGGQVDIGTMLVAPLRSTDPGTFGIDVKMAGTALEITTVTAGGPASAAGIVTGDKITAIQGHTITELTPDIARLLVSSASIDNGETLAVTLARGATLKMTAAKHQ